MTEAVSTVALHTLRQLHCVECDIRTNLRPSIATRLMMAAVTHTMCPAL